MTIELQVEGMHCGACVQKVEGALRSVEGVRAASVDLAGRRATIEGEPAGGLAALQASVAAAGAYSAEPAPAAHAGAPPDVAPTADEPPESLYPLFLIVGYLAAAVLLVGLARGDLAPSTLARQFMAGFFLVFSFFKLLDLRGFVDAYRGYDLVAMALPVWAWVYPFVELGLGALYLTDVAPVPTNVVTLVVMSIGAVGVLKALLDRRAIRCACLGTALNLPMTKVTLVEDVTMAAMAGAMLAFG